ncbi:hypothetical protein [Citrobacter sp. Res13-Sevr-PEB04-36]|uniref:hypothetical protein n=1 Tax=Citrobacter sp. Res13-Sevr-PEB04-36 TaxID=2777960 RepID=UPI0018ACE735|nr:hypothetical protein [Citrobacter sp. Res13-Sevr-PEB04-36]
MTTNHPAHGPLSLDRLHQISKILSKAAAQSDGGNLGYAMADAVKVIDEVLAVKDAEPVAWIVHARTGDQLTTDGNYVANAEGILGLHSTPLYTAKPAPVVPDNKSITQHFDTIALEVATEIMCDVNRRHEFLGGDVQLLSRIQCRIDEACRAAMLQAGNYPVTTDCWCRTCRPVTMSDMRFVVCPDCGNKRCPHANDHRNDCTGSNEPGQEGSAYPAAPQQEVKSALEHGMQRYAGAMQKLSEGDK